MKDKFNKYCAEVMGLEKDIENRYMDGIQFIIYAPDYNPYDDLNQMAEVVEKLRIIEDYETNRCRALELNDQLRTHPTIKQAFRDFIISTMPNEPT